VILELRRGLKREMMRAGLPAVMWDHCIELQCLIQSACVFATLQNEDDCGDVILTGETKDISSLVEHSWYDWVWFDMPEDKEST
jgi:hypothetical protein